MKYIILLIHPRWEIEEKAKIFRIEVWLIPEIAPIMADIIDKINKILEKKNKDKITIGEIFCQVNNRNEFTQFIPSKTSGNQKWKGDMPNFIHKDSVIIILGLEEKMKPLKK